MIPPEDFLGAHLMLFKAFPRPGITRTTGPFQKTEAGASFHCARGA
jgi:hypothetical protein